MADKQTTTAAEAAKIIEAEQKERTAAATAAVREVLGKYNCVLVASPVFTEDGRVGAQVIIRAA